MVNCQHIHDPQEWVPYTSNGRRKNHSREEADYTATLAFAIAVSASWWAARSGLAKLAVPRLPPFTAVVGSISLTSPPSGGSHGSSSECTAGKTAGYRSCSGDTCKTGSSPRQHRPAVVAGLGLCTCHYVTDLRQT